MQRRWVAAAGVAVVLLGGTAEASPAVGEEEGGAGRGLDVLPLGAGLVLVGLGLGFAGWRIRRG
jgi:hypothetical protein